MAATQSSTLNLSLLGSLSDAGNLSSMASPLSYAFALALAAGTGANQGNQIWQDRRTLTTGASETLDINGSLSNLLGQSITFTKVKLMLIVNPATNTTTLTVGNAATNGFVSWCGAGATNVVTIPPGGCFLICAPDATGFAATAATADQLKILNSAGASVTYDIVLIGVN